VAKIGQIHRVTLSRMGPPSSLWRVGIKEEAPIFTRLIPKVPLFPRGTKWILDRLLQSQFLSRLSKKFGEDRKAREFSKNIIFVSNGA